MGSVVTGSISAETYMLSYNMLCLPVFYALQGVIQLRFCKINELPLNSDEPGKYLFEIIPRKNTQRGQSNIRQPV